MVHKEVRGCSTIHYRG